MASGWLVVMVVFAAQAAAATAATASSRSPDDALLRTLGSYEIVPDAQLQAAHGPGMHRLTFTYRGAPHSVLLEESTSVLVPDVAVHTTVDAVSGTKTTSSLNGGKGGCRVMMAPKGRVRRAAIAACPAAHGGAGHRFQGKVEVASSVPPAGGSKELHILPLSGEGRHVVFDRRDAFIDLRSGVGSKVGQQKLGEAAKAVSASSSSAASAAALQEQLRQHLRHGLARHQAGAGTKAGVQTKWLKVLLVNDHARYMYKGSDTQLATTSLVTHLSEMFADLTSDMEEVKLRLQLVGIVTFNNGDPWPNTLGKKDVPADKLLQKFNEWRGRALEQGAIPDHAIAHLISGHDFSGNTQGYANVGVACRVSQAGGVIQGDHPNDFMTAVITAHEMAHNLGVNHNELAFPSGKGPAGGTKACTAQANVMDTVTGTSALWTPCAKQWLRLFFADTYGANGNPRCMDEPSAHLWTAAPKCGDGVVEGDEQCDCGTEPCDKSDPCCDGQTCRLKPGARCSALDKCCDTKSCAAAAKGTVCRPATGSCDVAETCEGLQGKFTCPSDHHAPVGEACKAVPSNADGRCLGGSCHAHTQQCLDLNNPKEVSQSCAFADHDDGGKGCGTLHCAGPGDPRKCQTWSNADGGILVEDGTPCDADKVCFERKCAALAEVTKAMEARALDKDSGKDSGGGGGKGGDDDEGGRGRCGNGIIEAGEDCDPGPIADKCCSDKCKLAEGAECSGAEPCCVLATCTYAPPSIKCRDGSPDGAQGCDPAEFCTGGSGACPADVTRPVGHACAWHGTGHKQQHGPVPGRCYKGMCRGHAIACAEMALKVPQWKLAGACASSRAGGDAACGSLKCHQEGAKDTMCIPSLSYNNQVVMVPDGSGCGKDKACFSGKCLAAPEVGKVIGETPEKKVEAEVAERRTERVAEVEKADEKVTEEVKVDEVRIAHGATPKAKLQMIHDLVQDQREAALARRMAKIEDLADQVFAARDAAAARAEADTGAAAASADSSGCGSSGKEQEPAPCSGHGGEEHQGQQHDHQGHDQQGTLEHG